MKIGKNFGTDEVVLFYGKYLHTSMPCILACCDDGTDVITEVILEVPILPDEILLNHDILFNKEFVEDLVEYLGVSKREVFFGPFGTMTYAVKLKENWKDLCLPFPEDE